MVGMLIFEPLEKAKGFSRVLKQAQWLGLHTQMQLTAGVFGDPSNMLHATPYIVANAPLLFRALDEFLKRTRRSADAPLDALGHQTSQYVKQAVGIIEPLRVSPIRQIDALFYPGTVKSSERESVDRKNVTIVFFKPALKVQQSVWVNQFTRGLITEPHADGVGLPEAELGFYRQGISVE